MNQSFERFDLQDFLLRAIQNMGIETPTSIQEQAIPALLKGRSVIGQSQTGTGKTLAYLLPIVNRINPLKQEVQALIMAPSRELTRQIFETAEELIKDTEIGLVLVQGGVDINRQIRQLRNKPQIVVGTPGRVLDLISQGELAAHTAKFLVIDEADTMLEMGFKENLENIIQKIKKDVLLTMFSATLPQKILHMAKEVVKKPLYIKAFEDAQFGNRAIENVFFKVKVGGKTEFLLRLINLYNPYLCIVFTKKKEQVDELVTYLRQAGVNAEGLHGDLPQRQRKPVMRRFTEAKSQVLVATDIASRGLDVEGITHVINYDQPITTDQYINRVGRTGRAGKQGLAVNLLYASELQSVNNLEDKLGQLFTECVIKNDEIIKKERYRITATEKIKTPVKPKKYTGPNAKKKAVQEFAEKKKQLEKKEAAAKARMLNKSKKGAKAADRGTSNNKSSLTRTRKSAKPQR